MHYIQNFVLRIGECNNIYWTMIPKSLAKQQIAQFCHKPCKSSAETCGKLKLCHLLWH